MAQIGSEQIRVQSTEESPVLHRLEVQVDASRVRAASERAYQALAKQVSVRGFRPGKTPRSVLEKLYGAQIAEQLEHTLVAETLADAIEQSGLEPVTQPAIDAQPPEPGCEFRYVARVEVKPALELPELNGLPARRPQVSVSEEEVGRELEALRERHAVLLEEPDGTAAAPGHVLALDYVGRIDGEPIEGGSSRDVEVELGAGQLVPGFDEQLAGARANDDVMVRVRFPDDYGNERLAGKDAEFAVHVVAVKRREVPVLDDEFAKDLGEFATLEDLRGRIRSDLSEVRERAARSELRRSLMDALIERTSFEVPPGLVERELGRQLAAAEQRLAASLPEDALRPQLERWREEWRGRAEREVRETLLLEAVARARGLTAEPDEIEARIQELAVQQGVEPARLRKAWDEERLEAALGAEIVERKAVDFLAATAKVEETTDA